MYYTNEDWDLMRANLEANKDILADIDIGSEDYAQKMVELVNQKQRMLREHRERERRNKPLTKGEQMEYMMNYVKS